MKIDNLLPKIQTTRIVVGIVAMILLVIVAITGLTLSWFYYDEYINIGHEINGAFFKVNLDEQGSDYIEAHSVNISDIYPTSDVKATEYIENSSMPVDNLYSFRITNVGNINIMYRFLSRIEIPAAEEDIIDTPSLPKQLKYSVRMKKVALPIEDGEEEPEYGSWSDQQFLIGDVGNVSISKYLENLLIYTDIEDEDYLESKPVGKIPGKGLGKTTSVYFQIYVWLDQAATQETTTCLSGTVLHPKSMKIIMMVHAKQFYTNAKWEAD